MPGSDVDEEVLFGGGGDDALSGGDGDEGFMIEDEGDVGFGVEDARARQGGSHCHCSCERLLR